MSNDINIEEYITMPALLDITERDACSHWDSFDQMLLIGMVALRRAVASFNKIEDDRATDKKALVAHHMERVEEAVRRMQHFGEGAEGWL